MTPTNNFQEYLRGFVGKTLQQIQSEYSKFDLEKISPIRTAITTAILAGQKVKQPKIAAEDLFKKTLRFLQTNAPSRPEISVYRRERVLLAKQLLRNPPDREEILRKIEDLRQKEMSEQEPEKDIEITKANIVPNSSNMKEYTSAKMAYDLIVGEKTPQKQLTAEQLVEFIRKQGNQYCVKSEKGKNLGCSSTHGGAKKRLAQVEYFKHLNKESQEKLIIGGEESKPMNQINRNIIAEEVKLRKAIRSLIEQEVLDFKDRGRLRETIRRMISEAETVAPRESTGLNVAEEVLKAVVPVLETGYKQATSSPEQRDSFKKHIMNSLKYFILPREISNVIDDQSQKMGKGTTAPPANETPAPAPSPEEGGLQEQVPEGEAPPPPTEKKPEEIADPATGTPLLGKPEEKEKAQDTSFTDEDPKVTPEQFGINGMDLVGRNLAYETFRNISSPIRRGYNKVQGSPKDREIYVRAIASNVLAHMDQFEKELQASPEGIGTPDYTSAQNTVSQTFVPQTQPAPPAPVAAPAPRR
jgi:hypothetical protein